MKTRRYSRVELEPELQEMAELWDAEKRLRMAKMFLRWARQLETSGFILFYDARGQIFPRPSLRRILRKKASLN
jgi:hypothetical protein